MGNAFTGSADLLVDEPSVEDCYISSNRLAVFSYFFNSHLKPSNVSVLFEDKDFIFAEDEFDGFFDLGHLFVIGIDFLQKSCESLDIIFINPF